MVFRGFLLSATGLLVGLGFLSLEASHHTHWHSTGGVVRAHDHAALGPHRHDAAEEPGKDGEDHQPIGVQVLLGDSCAIGCTHQVDLPVAERFPDGFKVLDRVSCGVEMIRISLIPASMRIDSG